MLLKEYLSSHNISQAAYADTLGVSNTYISHILSGRRRPSKRLCSLISYSSHGLVSQSDLLSCAPPSKCPTCGKCLSPSRTLLKPINTSKPRRGL